MKKWILLLLATVACLDVTNRTNLPGGDRHTVNIQGIWSFHGNMTYSDRSTCADVLTLAIVQAQSDTMLTGSVDHWTYTCTDTLGGTFSDSVPSMQLYGFTQVPDSVFLAFTYANTPIFLARGNLIDTLELKGEYADASSLSGTWTAIKE